MKSLGMLLFVLGLSLSPLTALAQDGEDAGESRAETFQAAEGAQTENIPGGMLMVGAYGVTLVLVLGYVVSIGMRQARTARELERLRADLSKREG
ncbi:MAG: CcmD family protein [Myxococcota bacterium]|nr:CcmD family protein [Myxococcota bacterium]